VIYYSRGHDFEEAFGVYTYLSFTYTEKTGVYMTMYYSTKIFQIHVPEYEKTYPVENVWEGFDLVWKTRKNEIES
jgi:hypothetical protein